MSKTALIIAILLLGVAFAVALAFQPGTQAQQSGRSQSGSVTHAAQAPDQLSMGPDPGGKTGDTVTPTTTKTGQPSTDGTGASHQSGASSGQPPSGTSTPSPTSPTAGRPGNDH